MENRTTYVHVDIGGTAWLAGRLETSAEGAREHARFEPDKEWLKHPLRHFIEPALALEPGPRKSGGVMPIFGALGDSAPDRWGRTLMRRTEREHAARAKRDARMLREIDFLLGVDDEVRAGNLRFADKPGGPFLGPKRKGELPGIKHLKRLLDAARRYQRGEDTEAQRDLLLVSGQLLGGSRPKGSIRDAGGNLAIAKLPSIEDERDMQRWEALTLGLAAECGIAVPAFRLERVEGERVLILRRFDREPGTGRRIGCVTMMGLLAANDNKSESYLEMVRTIRRLGSRPRDDLAELWRRAVFTVLVSDKDNHLRNHGLVLDQTGWRLAPAYDMNPTAQKVRPRELALSLDGVDDRAALKPLFEGCAEYALTEEDAIAIAVAVAKKVKRWREHAKALRLPEEEIRKMRPAFEHDDLEAALRGKGF
jgi:serine/threonine-protein kinase HipA